MRNSKWKLLVIIGVMIFAFMGGFVYGYPAVSANEPVSEDQARVVTFGAILPLTGELSSKGNQIRAALALSVEDVNVYLSETKQTFRVAIEFRDSRGIPDEALYQAKALHDEGISILIAGSSAEVEKIKPWSDTNEVIVVSYSSSAPSLGVADDSIFRVVPDDRHQVDALAHLIADQGVETVIPVYRNDVYGQEMAELFTEQFQKIAPSRIILPAIIYEPETTDFTQVAKQIEDRVAISNRAAEDMAVLLISFEEANQLFEVADRLQNIRWYGTETLTLNTSISESHKAVQFAQKVGFTGVSYGLLETSYYYKVLQMIEAEVQHYVMPNAIFAYDIPWLLASILPELAKPMDIKELMERFVSLSEQFVGASGWVVLNEAGDRKYSDFNIWQIQSDGNESYWVHIGTYLRNPGYPGYINWVLGYAPVQETDGAYLLGFNQSSYNPLSYVYRDEFTYMLMNTLYNGSLEGTDEEEIFFVDKELIDVRAIDSVELAVKNGVLVGYENQTLRPHQYITRGEMLTMVGRALKEFLPEDTIEGIEFYSDADQIPEWAKASIMKLTDQGLLNFEKGDVLGPHEPITLAEATAICISIIQSSYK